MKSSYPYRKKYLETRKYKNMLKINSLSLLCGSPAFHQSNINEDLNTKILCGNFNKSHPGLENVSGDAKDLIQKLLQVDPRLRLTARATLSHPWLDDPAMIQRARAVGSTAPLGSTQHIVLQSFRI